SSLQSRSFKSVYLYSDPKYSGRNANFESNLFQSNQRPLLPLKSKTQYNLNQVTESTSRPMSKSRSKSKSRSRSNSGSRSSSSSRSRSRQKPRSIPKPKLRFSQQPKTRKSSSSKSRTPDRNQKPLPQIPDLEVIQSTIEKYLFLKLVHPKNIQSSDCIQLDLFLVLLEKIPLSIKLTFSLSNNKETKSLSKGMVSMFKSGISKKKKEPFLFTKSIVISGQRSVRKKTPSLKMGTPLHSMDINNQRKTYTYIRNSTTKNSSVFPKNTRKNLLALRFRTNKKQTDFNTPTLSCSSDSPNSGFSFSESPSEINTRIEELYEKLNSNGANILRQEPREKTVDSYTNPQAQLCRSSSSRRNSSQLVGKISILENNILYQKWIKENHLLYFKQIIDLKIPPEQRLKLGTVKSLTLNLKVEIFDTQSSSTPFMSFLSPKKIEYSKDIILGSFVPNNTIQSGVNDVDKDERNLSSFQSPRTTADVLRSRSITQTTMNNQRNDGILNVSREKSNPSLDHLEGITKYIEGLQIDTTAPLNSNSFTHKKEDGNYTQSIESTSKTVYQNNININDTDEEIPMPEKSLRDKNANKYKYQPKISRRTTIRADPKGIEEYARVGNFEVLTEKKMQFIKDNTGYDEKSHIFKERGKMSNSPKSMFEDYKGTQASWNKNSLEIKEIPKVDHQTIQNVYSKNVRCHTIVENSMPKIHRDFKYSIDSRKIPGSEQAEQTELAEQAEQPENVYSDLSNKTQHKGSLIQRAQPLEVSASKVKSWKYEEKVSTLQVEKQNSDSTVYSKQCENNNILLDNNTEKISFSSLYDMFRVSDDLDQTLTSNTNISDLVNGPQQQLQKQQKAKLKPSLPLPLSLYKLQTQPKSGKTSKLDNGSKSARPTLDTRNDVVHSKQYKVEDINKPEVHKNKKTPPPFKKIQIQLKSVSKAAQSRKNSLKDDMQLGCDIRKSTFFPFEKSVFDSLKNDDGNF
ncbi:hypothetical protein BB560_006829, partial [Smittium megazygosporum]